MKLELFWPVEKPRNDAYNRFGENVEFYKSLNIGLEKGHNGIDITAQSFENTAMNQITFPVYAAHDGIVTYAGIEKNEGMGIVIRTKDAREYQGGEAFFKTIYWHNRYPDGIRVKVGQEVKVGDLIAYSDSTGISSGTHLHFGLKPIAQGENDWTWNNIEQTNGYFGAIDPMPYMGNMSALDYKKNRDTLSYIAVQLQKIMEYLKGR